VDVPQADTAITTPSSAAAMIHRLFVFDGRPDVALETGPAGLASWGLVDSYSLMMVFLVLRQLNEDASSAFELRVGRL
jgi:hypothetical protein